MHQVTAKSAELLSNGFIYLLGRDKDLRPVIILDVTKVSLKEGEQVVIQSLSVFLDMIKKYMFVPYHIENWVFILDVHEKGIHLCAIKTIKIYYFFFYFLIFQKYNKMLFTHICTEPTLGCIEDTYRDYVQKLLRHFGKFWIFIFQERMFIINPPWILKKSWGVITGFMVILCHNSHRTQRQHRKYKFFQKIDFLIYKTKFLKSTWNKNISGTSLT